MAMTLQARLARLEALESAQRFPTTQEFHRAVPVAADDDINRCAAIWRQRLTNKGKL